MDLTQTFLLYRGKGSRDPDELQGESIGAFKVGIDGRPQTLYHLRISALSFLCLLCSLSPFIFPGLLPQGSFKVYPLPDSGSGDVPLVFPKTISTKKVECVVRVYIIRVSPAVLSCALILHGCITDTLLTV